MKDRITFSYILGAVVMFTLIIVFFARPDFNSMNDNIGKGVDTSLKDANRYSDKLYAMVSSSWSETFVDKNNSVSTQADVKSTDVKVVDNVKENLKHKFSINTVKTIKPKLKQVVVVQSVVKKDINKMVIIPAKTNDSNLSKIKISSKQPETKSSFSIGVNK